MMDSGKRLICMVGILAFCAGGYAISADTPYQGIIDRNVFGLKSPPPPPDPEANKPAPPKITPTGITTILGNKRALFKVQVPAHPPEPAKEQSYIMVEGEREGQIEVLEIDEKAGTIKFNDYGTVVTLSLEKDGAKPQPGPPVGIPTPGGQLPAPVGYVPPAAPGYSGANPVTSFGGPNGGLKTIPTRTLRMPNQGANGLNPGPNSFGGGVVPQTQPTPQFSNLTPEEATILIEAERERTKEHVAKGLLPPLPPTELTPPGSAGLPTKGNGRLPQLPQ